MTQAADPSVSFEWQMRRIKAAHAARKFSRPSDHYIPGRQDWEPRRRFQLQFHQSKHIVRAMFPGNGAGKTTVVAVEADWWLQHNHPFQQTPAWPVIVVWVCQKFQQMEILRAQLEQECLTPGWIWNGQKNFYRWPGGDRMYVISNDGDWGSIQGIPIDLNIIDEECDHKLWRELTMRRRGRRKTRYAISATATKGRRWMYSEVYKPWLELHNALGLDEDAAMLEQKHGNFWVWPKGGLDDNPTSEGNPEDLLWYADILAAASNAEKHVRLKGGFMDLNAAPVFDHDQLKLMDAMAKADGLKGRIGILVQVEEKDKKLAQPVEYTFQEGGKYAGGIIQIWEEPTDDNYVMGADFGEGLENRDWDEVVVIRQSTRAQVAGARGRWGDVHFAWVLWALGWYYREAFLVGERQHGLACMRRLYDEWGYTYQYNQTDDKKKAPRKSDLIGHFRYHGDLIIPRLRWAIAPQELDKKQRPTGKVLEPWILIRDPVIREQMYKYEWKPRSEQTDMSEATFKDLSCGAPAGHFDDGVMGAAYGVTGLIELPKFIKPKRTFAGGSLGATLQHAKVLETKKPASKSAFSQAKR